MWGPGSTTMMGSADMGAPGAPTWSSPPFQVSNSEYEHPITKPTMDANSPTLSGLKQIAILTFATIDGVTNPFVSDDGTMVVPYDVAISIPGVHPVFVPTDESPVGINPHAPVVSLGSTHAFAIYANDEI